MTILAMAKSPLTFPYLMVPAPETVRRAFEILQEFGCLHAKGFLNQYGKSVGRLLLGVFSAVALLQTHKTNRCSDEVMTIVAMIEATDDSEVFLPAMGGDEVKQAENIRAHLPIEHPLPCGSGYRDSQQGSRNNQGTRLLGRGLQAQRN